MHIHSTFNCPLSSERADKLISLLKFSDPKNIFDAGCGTGEFLMKAVEATGAKGVGVDHDRALIKQANLIASKRTSIKDVTFQSVDLRTENIENETFDVAICLGATHAFAEAEKALPETVKKLKRIVRPGGRILIGEGYWKQKPDPQYLDFMGEPTGIYRSHNETVTDLRALGVTPIHACTANVDEWDEFEWGHLRRAEAAALEQPSDTADMERLIQRREWLDGYLKWGRSTMGFGYYLVLNSMSSR